MSHAILTGILGSLVALLPAAAQEAAWEWEEVTGPLPAGLTGPARQSREIALDNPLLATINEQLWTLPWAPGEAVLVSPQREPEGLQAFGFWNGPEEYLLLSRGQDGWRLLTSGSGEAAAEDRLAYFGHEVTGQPVAWTGPARLLVVGRDGADLVRVRRVPLFEAGCGLMVLERGERELIEARQFLGWMRRPPTEVVQQVAACQTAIDLARERLNRETEGLVDAYADLPQTRYILEVMAWISRVYNRGKSFEKIERPDLWEGVFYGRPEFEPCIAAREAAQEAGYAQRPETLAAETRDVFGQDAAFATSITHGMAKYRRDRPFPEPLRTEHRLSLAREEYEPFQVIVAALDRPVSDADVSVQWEGEGPHPQMSFQPVGYVETKPAPDNFTQYVGWWPDPLMPPGPVQVDANGTQPIWGRVYAPRGTPPGEHRATLTVTAEGMAPLTLHLTARVLDFDLGLTSLPSLLSLRLASIKAFYRLEEVPQEVKRRWYDFCLRYRMNPNNIYGSDAIPEEEDLDFCIERGFNAMVMTTPPLQRNTRTTTETMQVWISDDNVTYRQVEPGWEAGSDDEGGIAVTGLDVTARYIKLHSLFEDDKHEVVLRTLEPGGIVAYDGDREMVGPVGYAGPDDGTKPLGSWSATWGAAFDYKRVSLGVDLGEPQHVTKVVLVGNFGKTLEKVKRFHEIAEAHGLGDRAYVYGFDEWSDVERYGEIKRTYDLIKEVAPGVKACSTVVHPVPPIDDVIDAWCPALCYDMPGYKQARERGQEVWYYAGGAPYDPFPTHELLDVPGVEARAFFWVAWRFQYTGWLHWELNVWTNNLEGDKRWPEVPWDPARSGIRNGEVGRIYPGPDATPLPSVRLENMRDGIEDYDYFWLLREAAGRLPETDPKRTEYESLIERSIRELCPSRAHFERDPERVLAIHEELGKALEEALAAVPR